MLLGKGLIDEIHIQDERAVHITCAQALIPAPGQYILAQAETDSDSPLPQSVFPSGITPKGFYIATPVSLNWHVGTQVNLRGPLGHGFEIPATAKKIALINFGGNSSGLLALMQTAIHLKKEITLVSQNTITTLPTEVELLRLDGLPEALRWADYVAASLELNQIRAFAEQITKENQINTQVLINSEMPCAGLAECGVCAIRTRKSWLTACKDGPVFNLAELLN